MMANPDPACHIPVLAEEVVYALALKRGDTVVDCTVGAGGHAEKILEAIAPDGRLVGIDRDGAMLLLARERLKPFDSRVSLVRGNFRDLDGILRTEHVDGVDGVLMDVGVNSLQLGTAQRGFSFQAQGPLDMRMDTSQALTADDIVNRWPEEDVADILKSYGEVDHAASMARAIVRERARGPIRDTLSLARVVEGAARKKRRNIHPATQVFQALRIAVNDELGAMEEALPKAVDCLRLYRRLCVISFHSLEDRMVKTFFRRCAQSCVCPRAFPVCRCDTRPVLKMIGRKPVRPGVADVAANPRCRSARMRVAEKINDVRVNR